jgi:glycosyltransferase involved in cell wall biosynthesis
MLSSTRFDRLHRHMNWSRPVTSRGRVGITIYADTNLNVIDGSSVWTQSVALAFADVERCDVAILLKAPNLNRRLTGVLLDHDQLSVVDPFAEWLVDDLSDTLSPHQAAEIISRHERLSSYNDVVVVRGLRVASHFALNPILGGRLWLYLTDIPQHFLDDDPKILADLRFVVEASQVVLCQTEDLRTRLEQVVPETVGKALLLPPILPDGIDPAYSGAPTASGVNLVYSGKYAPAWRTLEMTDLPTRLDEEGVHSVLTAVGDKIHNDPEDRQYAGRMREALRTARGVEWVGGVERDEALRIAARAHLGLSWRAPEVSDSLELSTKVLEYCAVGTPPILNRTRAHEALLGSGYPLFAESFEDVAGVITRICANPNRYQRLASSVATIAESYTRQSATELLRTYVDRYFPARCTEETMDPIAVLVMSHDFKFFTRILDHLVAVPGIEVEVDRWPGLDDHDAAATLEALERAEVVICEWCGPNAIFASRHKRPGQRLIVRLHRFELDSGYWKQVNIDAVDSIVAVSPYYRERIVEVTGWPDEKVVCIPNWVDNLQLDRPKIQGARFNLGLVGAAPSLKRLDLAFDVLARLREADPRFHLFVKSKMPWEYPWIWAKDEEKQRYAEAFRKLRSDRLAGAVVFDPFGPDVARWFRKIGFILSTSDLESFHLAVSEGMASGAVPVIRPWPGAERIYAGRWLRSDPDAMASFVLEVAQSDDRWQQAATEAKEEATRKYALTSVLEDWMELVLGARTAVR